MNPEIYKEDIDWIFLNLRNPCLTEAQRDQLYCEADYDAVQILKNIKICLPTLYST